MINLETLRHYICTYDEAHQIFDRFERFWVTDCPCRKKSGPCKRSKTNVCVSFSEDVRLPNVPYTEIDKKAAHDLIDYAEEVKIIPSPLYDGSNRDDISIFCICCDDCCDNFKEDRGIVDKGSLIEKTEMSVCTQCGLCEPTCYYGARRMVDGELVIDQDKCYGCGICKEVCPADCIKMTLR